MLGEFKLNENELKKLQDRYRLGEAEAKEYGSAVNLFFTTGKKKEEVPRLVFISGQSGAGKSRLIPLVNGELSYNAVISDFDTIRAMHPNFGRANREDPINVHLALLPDADKANVDLRNYCRRNKLNFINEGTMRNTEGFIKMAKEFRESGYFIELALMAVPKLESFGSTFLRYATDLVANNSPRWVPQSVHDESYDNYLVTLQEFVKQSLFDRATVYRRGNDEKGTPVKIYSTEERQFRDPVEAVKYGRQAFRKDTVRDYDLKHGIVHDIFSQYAPQLLPELKSWEDLYEIEKESLLKDEEQK